ncbi:MAG: chemotaxis response regulator protein-glutamate methylesterase [Planctomycetota bacterium]
MKKLRVLVVDDSIIFRMVVRECFSELPGVEVVAAAKDGIDAIEKIKQHKPDLVTLDVHMPGKDGIEVLQELQRLKIDTCVIMVSSETSRGAATTTKALQIGAFDFILKPNKDDRQANKRELKAQLSRQIDQLKRHQSHAPVPAAPTAKRPATGVRKSGGEKAASNFRPEAICIGISTGGPRELSKVIPALSKNIQVPILIVQHMPPLFTATMAQSLDLSAKLTVVEGSDGAALQPGHIYIAPGGKQMRLTGVAGASRIEITDDPPIRACKPSVDYLFESAASHFRHRLLAIVMTGMGDDGTRGCKTVAAKGGQVWAQDRNTSTVYGMPRSVAEAGLADQILSSQEIIAGIERCGSQSLAGCRS